MLALAATDPLVSCRSTAFRMDSTNRMDLTALFRSPEYYVPFKAGDVIFKRRSGDAMHVASKEKSG